MYRKKKIIIITMCVAIFLMAVGYAAFSSNLKINGTASVTSIWQILFTKIEEVSKTDGVTIISSPTASGTTATFNVGLKLPGDSIEYKITVENQGTVDAIINDIVASETGSDAIKFEIENIKEGDILSKESSTTFNITISYDESVTSQPTFTDNELSITINYMQYTGQSITSTPPTIDVSLLSRKILQDNVAQADTNIDFSKTSEEDGTKGLYYTSTNTEDNKTTYYFRGAVDNNYVKFGKSDVGGTCTYNGTNIYYINMTTGEETETPTETQCLSTSVCVVEENFYVTGVTQTECEASDVGGTWTNEKATYTENIQDMYWRIIRINEDGSVRLIYQGLSVDATGTDAAIGTSAFNSDSGDNAYVGYMYGTSGSSTYEETHANTNNSTIKAYIDSWYETTLKDNYATYLADSGFCNDRSVSSKAGLWSYGDTALGYGTTVTYYGSYNRLYNLYQPQFACPNESNDLFTTSSSSKGNKALDHPIGLITADEVAYAGGVYGIENTNFYLNHEILYWTMSPKNRSQLYLDEETLDNVGAITFSLGVKPVINLESTVEIENGGTGTSNNPYVIKTN